MIVEWKPLKSRTVKQGACATCGKMSTWHPRNWLFRHIPVRGKGVHGPKVTTERLCPVCVARLTPQQETEDAATQWRVS